MNDLTLAVAGLAGSIGTTLAAGLAMLREGGKPQGLITELPWPRGATTGPTLAERLGLPPLASLEVAGWDLDTRPLSRSASEKGIIPPHALASVADRLEALAPFPGVAAPRSDWVDRAQGWIEEVRASGRDLVIVDLLPTTPTPRAGEVYQDADAFELALRADCPGITPSMVYAWLALSSGVPYLNFTPNVSAEIPALRETARRTGTPFCGKDGKTGQTLLKTALAPMLALRGLQVQGWISANYLGNADGQNLSEPGRAEEKLHNKAGVLEPILGYAVPDHIVDIRYYGPRGDFKESWDNIDLVGFGDIPMQLKVNFLCADSALAAPLVVDAARLLHRAAVDGASGPQPHLSAFFKQPLADEAPQHDLFRQRTLLEEWVAGAPSTNGNGRGA